MPIAVVTGGAGLIGSHITDQLLNSGFEVKVIDNLEAITHQNNKKPGYIPDEVDFYKIDVRDSEKVKEVIKEADFIFHNAATGGFTPRISEYFESNTTGTARLMEIITKNKIPIKKLIVASSVGVYGEGKYQCKEHGVIYAKERPIEQLKKREWELKCPICNALMSPLPIDENTPINPKLIYSISKYDQEKICLLLGKQHNIPTVILRYFATYGPRQSLFNPYTGLCSIFSMQILNDKSPIVFEDGNQTRDFAFVEDVAKANLLVAKEKSANFEVFNIGTGVKIRVIDIARILIKKYKKSLEPSLTGEFRPSDARHVVADISKIKELGFKPEYSFEKGIEKYLEWIKEKSGIKDYFNKTRETLLKNRIILKSENEN